MWVCEDRCLRQKHHGQYLVILPTQCCELKRAEYVVVYLPGSEQTTPSLLRTAIKIEGEVWQAVTRINIIRMDITRINITAIITNNIIYTDAVMT